MDQVRLPLCSAAGPLACGRDFGISPLLLVFSDFVIVSAIVHVTVIIAIVILFVVVIFIVVFIIIVILFIVVVVPLLATTPPHPLILVRISASIEGIIKLNFRFHNDEPGITHLVAVAAREHAARDKYRFMQPGRRHTVPVRWSRNGCGVRGRTLGDRRTGLGCRKKCSLQPFSWLKLREKRRRRLHLWRDGRPGRRCIDTYRCCSQFCCHLLVERPKGVA
jgi:hypothetical protein